MIGKRFFDWRTPLNYRQMFAVICGIIVGILVAMWLGELGENILTDAWTEMWS